MSSVEALREFINERLTAAAGEIFTVFQQTIVRYEEEIDRQRKLMTNSWKPHVEFHTTASPEQPVSVNEQLSDDSLTQEEAPPSPVFKAERAEAEPSQPAFPLEDFHPAQVDKPLLLKHETGPSTLTFADGSGDHCEPEPDLEELLSDNSASNQEKPAGVILTAGPKPDGVRRGGGAPRAPDKRKKCYKCGFCGKPFKCVSKMLQHHRIHTGEKPYSCQMCEKTFRRQHHLVIHMRTHTGEKPYSCQVCGKTFRRQHHLLGHAKTHEGEKPCHICNICGKSYAYYLALKKHLLSHPGNLLQN